MHANNFAVDVHGNIIHNRKYTCTVLERTKCSSRGEWIHKFLVCPLHRYSMATKRRLSPTLPKSVYAPQQPGLSERNQVQRKTIYSTNTNMKSFTWNSREDMIRKQVVSGAGTGEEYDCKKAQENLLGWNMLIKWWCAIAKTHPPVRLGWVEFLPYKSYFSKTGQSRQD